tara:strand:- start:242 stop:409 length:168 start_codon:yes stop_codon:yes gene_type:complete
MIRTLFLMLVFCAPGFNSQHSGAPQCFTHHAKDFVFVDLGCYSGKTGEELKAEGK